MRDPHVEAVYFKVSSGEGISYKDPEPLSFSNHLGDFYLVDGELKVVPNEHFGSGQEASQAIEPFLRAWEIEADLKRNLGTIRFTYSRADEVDRNPPLPGESQVVYLKGCAAITIGASAHCHMVLKRYPEPPEHFSASEYAQYAYRRWLGYRNGSEPLLAMAYFILTLLERQAGSRANACILFNVERKVLDRFGSWCSERGSVLTARKAKSTDFDDLSHIEKEWLERAAKRLIFRLGEQVSGQPLDQITGAMFNGAQLRTGFRRPLQGYVGTGHLGYCVAVRYHLVGMLLAGTPTRLPNDGYPVSVNTNVITVRAAPWRPSISASTTSLRRVLTRSWKSSASPPLN